MINLITSLLLITIVFSQPDPELTNYPEISLPSLYALDSIYPNPFNPVANIRYALPDMAKLSLAVYNLNGKQVAKLYNGTQTPVQSKIQSFDKSLSQKPQLSS